MKMFYRMMDWLSDRPARMIGVGAAMFLGSIGLLVWASSVEQKHWDEFAAAHDCQVIGKIAGHTAYGYYNGKYQSYWVSSKTVYKCNDGIEYTR